MSIAELHSAAMRAAAFDELDVEVAVLDADGMIVETNVRWCLFSEANGGVAAATGVGVNYLDVCDRSAAAGATGAADVAAGLRQILDGDRHHLELSYACPSPTEERWFGLRASPICVGEWTGAVVFHHDETVRQRMWEELRAPRLDVGVVGANAAFLHSRDLLGSIAVDGTIQSASPACQAMFGVEPATLIGSNGFDMIHPRDREGVRAAFQSAAVSGDSLTVRFRVRDVSGTIVWLEGVGKNLLQDPHVGGIVGSLRDVTEQVRVLERSETLRRRLEDATASAQLGSFVVDLDDGSVIRSAELWRIFGMEPGGEDPPDMHHVHPDDQARVTDAIQAALASGEPGDCTYRIVRVDGTVRWVRSLTMRVGESNVLAGTMLDITEHHEADLALAHQAAHDWLTQLLNAASLHERLQAALTDGSPNELVAVAMLDIDHFKAINDRSGRAHGDEVLRAVAARLTERLPASDVIARLSSDEFVIVRTAMRDLDDAGAMGEDIMQMLRDPLMVGERALLQTVSVGVALSAAGDTPVSILHDADDAMYQSKRDGRDRVTVFDQSARLRSHRRQDLTGALSLALERDELHLEYQPIIDLHSMGVVGFEALLRWEHPVLGRIAPDEFIPLAEATGLILPMAGWVFERAMAQLAQWRAQPGVARDLWMSMNVSGAQLAQPRLAMNVRSMLEAAGLPAESIHLEITERVLMNRIEGSPEAIVALQAIGVGVSIDDFGTGSSSLSYLSRLPVDTIKIDRSFVRGLAGASAPGGSRATTGVSDSIIRAIIALANTLDLAVVAEGVEREAQLTILRDLGCRFGQGFLWSRSMRADVALAWLTERSLDVAPVIAAPAPPPRMPADFGAALLGIARGATGRLRTARERESVVRFGALEVCSLTKRAWLGGRDLELTDREFDLLAFLTSHEGAVFSPTDLLREVWHSSPTWQSIATVAEHIHRLRRRVEAVPARPTLIRTVRGRGYCFGTEQH